MRTVTALAVCIFWGGETVAQDLTPRLYWPAPQGTKILVTGYSHASGNVLIDRSIPLYNVDSNINVGIVAYLQTLGLWGRTSNFLVELPYTWGNTKGFIGETPARRDFSDFGDFKFTLTVNLLGAPSLTPQDFLEFRANPRPIVGASLKVVAPTGHYDPNRLINVGANRWATRLQLGSVIPLSPSWLLELEAGVWFFGDDDEYLQGAREQDPIYSAQVNFIKRFRPGLWASLDFTYFAGGRQTIGGERLDDTQQNAKIGGTVVIPFAGRHAVKFGYANSAVTKYGSDFDQFLFTYQYLLK
ncbi:MAG: transporter [Xanthomonadales bacterium]|nr:transporter [Xanthomonadales bacterium]MDH3941081.1 transporter [Xanthomonadales bacterium]